ncbi:MAG: response regulator [Dehalococcoidia bacterium]|nr:MAG: response regulator [Dehalococcoidia bacterium]
MPVAHEGNVTSEEKPPYHFSNIPCVETRDRLLLEKISAKDRTIAKARAELRKLIFRLEATKKESVLLRHQLLAAKKQQACHTDPSDAALRYQLHACMHSKAELQRSLDQFRALVESSADHLFILSQGGDYLFSNDRVRHFGLDQGAQLVGKRLQDVYPPQPCRLYQEKLHEVFRTGEVVSFHHETKRCDNAQSHLDTLFPIYRDEEVWAVGGLSHDMSEQKQIEKQLFQAQKLDALGTLVAGVAHEINNPINLILFNLPLFEKIWRDVLPILDKHPEDIHQKKLGGLNYAFIKENVMRLASDMELAANRVARIVNGLKEFARKGNPTEKADISINQAVENATRLAAATLQKSNTTLTLDLSPDLPILNANLQNIEQIVLNLIINAFQSIDQDNGVVTVRTARHNEDQSILIEVVDNGCGINPAVADKIFDPFVTDRQASGGTGLGLSVTYNLVKAHQGEIFFKTKAGQGTTFSVILPTMDMRRPRKVMVVDDDKTFRHMLTEALTKRTHSVVEGFANGAEALIRLGSYPPDLLILDMFMPQIDGLGVCRAIKNELGLQLTKVIIVTGFPEHPNLTEAARMGFHKIFTKPLALEEFMRSVKESLYGKPA